MWLYWDPIANVVGIFPLSMNSSVCEKDWRSRKRGKPEDMSASLERGERARRSNTRVASQAFERTETHAIIQRKHTVLAVKFLRSIARDVM